MKKFISALLVVLLVTLSLCAAFSVSAADAKATYKVNWLKLSYNTYTPNDASATDDYSASTTKSAASTYEDKYDVTKESNKIASEAKSGTTNTCEHYYIASTQISLADGAQFEYEFKIKRNGDKHTGIPFAIDGDVPYVIYSDFSSNMRFCKGPRNNEKQNFTPSLTLDSGYAQMKVVFNGFTATIYAMKSGSYKQQGEPVTLNSGSRIVFGIYSREGTGSSQRTPTVKDATLYGMNDEAAKLIKSGEAGFANAIVDYVRTTQETYKEADYTADSYKALKTALDAATAAAKKAEVSQEDVDAAKQAIDKAVEELVESTNVDTSKLDAALAKVAELEPYKIEYTEISYAMVTKAVDAAKELLATPGVKQSALEEAAEIILGRISELVPSGLKVARPSANSETTAESSSETLAEDDGGCRSAVATTAVVIGAIAMIGTALVVKKKD